MQKIYNFLPVLFQNLACSLYGWLEKKKRFGSRFESAFKSLLLSEWATGKQIQSLKNNQLVETLFLAKENEYYKPFMIDVSEKMILENPFYVLSVMPILTKESVVQNCEKIRITSITGTSKIKTSGTTGKCLSVYKTTDDFGFQWAVWCRHRNRFGVQLGDVSVNFTGKLVVPTHVKKPPFWRYNFPQKQYLINMQHINAVNIVPIVNFLNSIKPIFYSGYPSIISEVCRLAQEQGMELYESSRPKVIFCGAENTLENQKSAMVAWTGAKVTDQYGLTEGVCNFSKCEFDMYHEDFEFGHIEVAEPELLSGGRVRGKLVGTSFKNSAFPLIRYETGDVIVAMPDSYKCECGRLGLVIESVEGRMDDYILTPDGRRIMRFDYLFKDSEHIREVQVVQRKVGQIIFKCVARGKLDKLQFEADMVNRVKEWISPDLEAQFEYVKSIEKSATGKFKAVVNSLN